MARTLAMLVVSSCLLACGSSRSPTEDGGAGDGGSDGCPADLSAAEGTPCAEAGLSCGGPCTDPCSFCNRLMCDGTRWTRLEVFPAPCFACGESECVGYSQYCDVVGSDVGGVPSTYECVALPSECTAEPTCECVSATVTFDSCMEDASMGAVTVTHAGG